MPRCQAETCIEKMRPFLIVSVANEDLSEIVKSAFEPDDSFKVNDSTWRVSRSGVRSNWEVRKTLTPSEASVAADDRPKVIIVPMKGYYGRANASVWQWCEVKVEQEIERTATFNSL